MNPISLQLFSFISLTWNYDKLLFAELPDKTSKSGPSVPPLSVLHRTLYYFHAPLPFPFPFSRERGPATQRPRHSINFRILHYQARFRCPIKIKYLEPQRRRRLLERGPCWATALLFGCLLRNGAFPWRVIPKMLFIATVIRDVLCTGGGLFFIRNGSMPHFWKIYGGNFAKGKGRNRNKQVYHKGMFESCSCIFEELQVSTGMVSLCTVLSL